MINTLINLDNTKSHIPIKRANKNTEIKTTVVALINSSLVDQETFFSSVFTSVRNFFIRFILFKTLAGEAGIEPATAGFGVRCSRQLSYSPIKLPDLFIH